MNEARTPSGDNQYCLVCAYAKPRGVWDANTGIYVCIECRDAGTSFQQALEQMELIKRECIEGDTMDSCPKILAWVDKFLSAYQKVKDD